MQALSALGDAVGELEHRLVSVLRSDERKVALAEPREGYSAELASQIGEHADSLENLNGRLRDLLQRLEL